jgi:hypothetical protein
VGEPRWFANTTTPILKTLSRLNKRRRNEAQ